MSYYIGQFYISKRDIFLLTCVLLLALTVYIDYNIPYFEKQQLMVLAILALFAKGLLIPTRDDIVYLTFFLAIALTLFIPFLQVLIFLFFSFLLLHLFRVI